MRRQLRPPSSRRGSRRSRGRFGTSCRLEGICCRCRTAQEVGEQTNCECNVFKA
jgi:hypothetical protein